MKILVVIPARYASSRFPGKPLVMLGNRSMIQRTWEQVAKSDLIDRIVIATDDERILNHALAFGAEVRMTSSEHQSGTNRCDEVLSMLESEGYHPDILINVQGDEPFFNPEDIGFLITAFTRHQAQIATLKHLIHTPEELQNSSVVKVVCARNGDALYFSRSPIPFLRDPGLQVHHYRHQGVYAFTTSTLHEICKLPPSENEQAESLEQLRWLDNGYRIKVIETPHASIGIDNPWDIDNFAGQFPLD